MGGYTLEDDEYWESHSPARTVVLVGRSGNGKSATGNSILGRKEFLSKAKFGGVTTTCDRKTATLKDGQIVNVIDTPGLFDSSSDLESLGEEIAKCISMAKDGIHAILVVVSLKGRFTKEEEAAIASLRTFFGNRINDYMIAAFTHGDDLEEDEALDDRLLDNCPDSLKKLLEKCGNRRLVFDNKTKDQVKKAKQIEQLLSLVNEITKKNGGKPYTNELFVELKKGVGRLLEKAAEVGLNSKQEKDELEKKLQEQMQTFTFLVISKLTKLEETTHRLERQLSKSNQEVSKLKGDLERAQTEADEARSKAEENAKAAEEKSNEQIRKLRDELERAIEENAKESCTIL